MVMKGTRMGSQQAMAAFPGDDKKVVWKGNPDSIRNDAAALAKRLVPSLDSSGLLFDEGARAILATCIVKLQTERPGQWTWFDLVSSTKRDDGAVQADAERYYPTAVEWLRSDGRLLDAVWSTLHMAMFETRDCPQSAKPRLH
ncbi:hypothetical protein VSX64_17975 [Aurantimonas sp. C2-6-R+9]|uniref:hypothetical protein n=1 Tax=unclassified Aurantimonas TaxID=2638230 RepID=UPI002E197BCA|nr:hypothetical protein [Aurantimonas sp. C2-6-R+9]